MGFSHGNSFIHIFVHLSANINGCLASAKHYSRSLRHSDEKQQGHCLKELESSWKASLLYGRFTLGSDIEPFVSLFLFCFFFFTPILSGLIIVTPR